jgi:hypothetical protein
VEEARDDVVGDVWNELDTVWVILEKCRFDDGVCCNDIFDF